MELDAACLGVRTASPCVETTSQLQQTVGQVASLVSRFRTAPPRARKQRHPHADAAPSLSGEQPHEPAHELQAVHNGECASRSEHPENRISSSGDTDGLVLSKSVASSDAAVAGTIQPGCSCAPNEIDAHMLDITASMQSVASAHSMVQSAVVHTVSQLRTAPPRRTACLDDQKQLSKQEALHQLESPNADAEHASELTGAATLAADQHEVPLCTDACGADVSAGSKHLVAAYVRGTESANIHTLSSTLPLLQSSLGTPAPSTSMLRTSGVGEGSVQGTGEDDSVSKLLKRCRSILSSRNFAADSVASSSHGSAKMLTSSSACAAGPCTFLRYHFIQMCTAFICHSCCLFVIRIPEWC